MKTVNRYQKYRDSETKWLGDIPSHWNIKKLRSLCSIKTGNKNTDDRVDAGEYPFFVRSKKVEKINSYSFNGEAILTAGDGDIGKIFHHINGKFDFHQRVYAFYDFKINPRFLYHYLTSNLYHKVKSESAKVTVGSIRLPMLENFLVSVPSDQEQEAIAYFLDDKVGDITVLTHIIDGQIKNLKDYKKSLLKSTVGKLFELDDGYKTRLKNLVEYNIGGVWGNDVKNDDHKIVVVRVSDFDKEKMNIKDSNLTFREITNNEVESRKLKKGDILVEKSGGGATSPVGNIVLFDKDYDAVFSNFTTLLRFDNKKCDSNFMKFVLKYIYDSGKVKKSIKQNTGIQNLDMQYYLSNELSLPEKARQREIANTLNEQYKIIDEAIKKAKKQKQNLIDYKKVLINDVVTGKIKVYNEELN